MTLLIGNIYKNSDNELFTPAQSGNYYICDMWPCDKNGEVKGIDENPCPIPKLTNDMVLIGESKFTYEYPEFNPQF